jgi:NAD-dependent DNA ligase
MIPKPKYTELMVNLIKRKTENDVERKDIINALQSYDVNINYKEYSTLELHILYRIFDVYIGNYDMKSLKKFVELNERNLIKNNNLSTYKSFDDVRLQISLAELSLIDKDVEKQVLKIFENSEWLVLKPLSWNSSKKYGANTRWCTSSEQEPDYFYKYSKKGILIYAINKISGDKIAGFCQISDYDDRELSFWNIIDRRIDSIEANLPDYIMDIFKTNGRDYTVQLINAISGFDVKTTNKVVDSMDTFIEYYKKLIKIKPNVVEVVEKETNLADDMDVIQPSKTTKSNKYAQYSGKTIVFTGFRIKEVEAELEKVGAKITTSVSKNTSLVVAADPNEESSKVVKANELGIQVMSKDEFLKTLE